MEPGTRVEVRRRFDRSWARGFEIVEVVEGSDALRALGHDSQPPPARAYRVRRRSDGSVLPALFSEEDVREEKKGRSMWWY